MRVDVEQVEGRRFRIRARGVEAIVDDTLESGGPGAGFRPTELVLGAPGACMAGMMLNFTRNQVGSRSALSRSRSRRKPPSARSVSAEFASP